MMLNWKLWSKNKLNNWIVKLAVVILLMGLAFRLFFTQSSRLEPEIDIPRIETPLIDKIEVPTQIAPVNVSELQPPPPIEVGVAEPPSVIDEAKPENETLQGGKCDIFTGDWVPNPSGPRYTNASCPLIEGHQNCMWNGRPDSGYLYWRWSPWNCELPPFDAQRFLELMRDKTWALIGDSISRNHVQSLLCMLSNVEPPTLIYHDEDYKSKTWCFPSYNLTIANVWSPFLVTAAIFEDNNGVSTAEVQLQLDKLDKTWTNAFQSYDYAIISTGKWFLKAAVYHENDTIVGCHICPAGKNLTELGFDYAYKTVLRHAMDFVASSKHKGMVFFRTSTPDHFENGEWHNGGTCSKTEPAKAGEIELKDLNRILLNIELPEFEQASKKATGNGVNLKLLDFTKLLLTRPDGHPGPYRQFHPFAENKTATVQNDCLHWCLPGPIDYWNDVIMKMAIGG